MTPSRRFVVFVFFVVFAPFVAFVPPVFAQEVSFDRILRADKEPQNWLSYSGTVLNQRYSGQLAARRSR